jgi:hypothetical protein
MAQRPADVRQQSQINAGIVTLAAAQTAQLWQRVDWASPSAATAVRTLYGAIVDQFGQSAAAVAAQFYDEQRALQTIPSRYTATMADPLPPVMLDKIVTSAFFGATDEYVPPSEQTLSDLAVEQRVPQRLDGQLQRLVLQPGRDTIAQNVANDPAKPRYVRVPQSTHPCAFCVMLASRELGPRFHGYTSKESAGDAEGTKYHPHCDCEAVPVFGDAADVSPNIADYGDMYLKARADAGSGNTKKILASMRRLHGLK